METHWNSLIKLTMNWHEEYSWASTEDMIHFHRDHLNKKIIVLLLKTYAHDRFNINFKSYNLHFNVWIMLLSLQFKIKSHICYNYKQNFL